MTEELERPARYTPTVTARSDAPAEYIKCGQRYWEWLGVRTPVPGSLAGASSVWAEATKRIAEDVGEPSGRLYIFAHVGVEATLPEIQCPRCGTALALKSRTTLDELIRDGNADGRCARCDPRIGVEVARLRDPARAAARAEKRRVAAAQRKERDARLEERRRLVEEQTRLRSARLAAVAVAHPLALSDPETLDWTRLRTTFRTEVGTLAILDYSPGDSVVPAVNTWDDPLTPNDELTGETLAAALHAGLLRIHPESRPEAFVWDEDVIDRLTNTFYPASVDWYCGLGPSLGTAMRTLQHWLRERTSAWLRTEHGVHEATALAHELIVCESMRYLDDQLAVHNLPGVPENHRGRLLEATGSLASEFSLGQCYSIAWRAARNAATMTRRHPYAPEVNATAHAVNTFEQMAADAVAAPNAEVQVYREDRRTSLSALTRTLFLRVLEADPMATSILDIEAALRSAEQFPQAFTSMLDSENQPPEPSSRDDNPQEATSEPRQLAQISERYRTLVGGFDRQLLLDVGRLDAFLANEPAAILEASRLTADSCDAVADGLQRLGLLRAMLHETLASTELGLAVLAVALLLPGTVESETGEQLSLGDVLGEQLGTALVEAQATT